MLRPPSFRTTLLTAATALLGMTALLAMTALADDTSVEYPSRDYVEDAVPQGGTLTGQEIWEKFLENRMHSAMQYQTVISTDPGGSMQETRFWVRWKDFRDDDDEAVNGVLGKTLVKFSEPFDMRHTGFLMILREDRGHDQFVYLPSSRKVRRLNMKDVSVMGTDFSLDDFAFRDVDDAEYRRLSDEVIDGIPVFVVEAEIRPGVESPYSRTRSYLEQEHYIPLRSRFWDRAGVEVKEMTADPRTITEFNGVWVATNAVMRNLKRKTSSQLVIERLDANVDIADNLFSVFRLSLRR